MVPIELKKTKAEARDADLCLAKQVSKLFRTQPTRSFVVGLTLCGSSMRLWQFDRAGAIGSELLDINETNQNLSKFLTLILLFVSANKQVLGFDPTFIDTEAQVGTKTRKVQMIQVSTKSGPQDFIIDRQIFRARGICGRGTTCWQAHLSGDKHTKFLIKDSWQPADGKPEGEMLRKVTEKEVPHVARYHHHEDVKVASQIVDLKSYVRADLDFESCEKIQVTDEWSEESLEFSNRVHRRLILRDVGQPIWKVKGPAKLLEAFESCIKGHQGLVRAGYLHRDISISNLMIHNQAADPDRKAFLIDLDVATEYPLLNPEDRYARVGTKAFMSASLLSRSNPHDVVDDLESFLWVLVWLCTGYRPVYRPQKFAFDHWDEYSPTNLGWLKARLLRQPDELVQHFTPTYAESEPLICCVNKLAALLSQPNVRTIPAEDLYAHVLQALQLAQTGKVE
jgi:hypothetical protein